MQSIITCVLAFVISAVAGRFIVPALRALKVGQSIREIGPTWHNSKQGTPTMGGLIFMLGIAVCVITGWRTMLGGDITHLMVFGLALVCGVIGFLDDFVKVKNKRNLGLTEIQKLVLQLAAAASWSASFWISVRPRFRLFLTLTKSSKNPMTPQISARPNTIRWV